MPNLSPRITATVVARKLATPYRAAPEVTCRLDDRIGGRLSGTLVASLGLPRYAMVIVRSSVQPRSRHRSTVNPIVVARREIRLALAWSTRWHDQVQRRRRLVTGNRGAAMPRGVLIAPKVPSAADSRTCRLPPQLTNI